MANPEHLAILKQGVDVWNKWRDENPDVQPDLSYADLSDLDLNNANFNRTDLSGADLSGSDLCGIDFKFTEFDGADFRGSYLCDAIFFGFDLSHIDFEGVDLSGADLKETDLSGTNFTDANLSNADLRGSILERTYFINTNIEGAKISGSYVYSSSVWDLKGEFKEQNDLILSPFLDPQEKAITVDNLRVAQFVYLILNNPEIREVINELTSKSVLILGRFSPPERKDVLDRLRNKLREFNLLPIVFDFDRPAHRDFTEIIKTLVGLCYFVIADITNPKSSPLELQATVPDYQIPFVPIIQAGEEPFAMMANLQTKYDWVLDPLEYETGDQLMAVLEDAVINPAVEMHNRLQMIKARQPKIRSASDFLEKGDL
jgi:hypothetical protein